MSLDTELRALEVRARDLLIGLTDQVTIRGGRIVESKDGTTLMDIVVQVDSETGNRRAGGSADLSFELFSAGRSQFAETARTLAEDRLQAALDILYGDNELGGMFGAKKAGTTYERGTIEGGREGSYAWAVLARIGVNGYRVDASPDKTLGIVIGVTGTLPFGNSTVAETAKLTEIEVLTPQSAPASVTAWYVNAVMGDDVELLDAADVVVDTFVVPADGNGRATFTSTGAGVYRSRLDGNISNLTACVVVTP